jgi:acyl carrier protein
LTSRLWDDSFENIVRPFLGLLDDAELPADVDMQSLGLDSLNAVQLLFALEDHYQLDLSTEFLGPELFASPATLWEAIRTLRTDSSGTS